MNKIKLLKPIFLFFLAVFALSSCKDKDGNPTLEKPVLVVTPTVDEVGAGNTLPFSVDGSGFYKLANLKVEETYGGKKTMLLDSTFNPPKTALTFAYNYKVPDTAIKDQPIVLVFTLTDEKGNSTTETENITVKYGRPLLIVEGDKTSAKVGEKVNFNISASSPSPDLAKIEISESKNGALGTIIKTETLPAGTSSKSLTYEYTVPEDLLAGQYVIILFKAFNDAGISATITKRINIE